MPGLNKRSHWAQTLYVLLLCLALIGVTRFLFAAYFGIYEDDYTRIPLALKMNAPELIHQIVMAFTGFVDHGKPLHTTIIYTLAMLGVTLNGLQGIYLIAYLINGTNAILFFLLIKQISPTKYAIIAAISFVLFSGDITQAFITHALGLQTSLTFLLLAFHAYGREKRWLAYTFALAVLLTYETPYLIFLTAPLLFEPEWTKTVFRSLIQHALILGALLLAIILLRSVIGETRITGLGFPEVLTTPLSHMLQGPIVSLGTYLYRPYQALITLPWLIWFALLPIFFIFLWTLAKALEWDDGKFPLQLNLDRPSASKVASIMDRVRLWIQSDAAEFHLLLLGLLILVLAYPLTFTVRAFAISGRDTRVHLAAALGAAMVWAWIWTQILLWLKRQRTVWVGIVTLSTLFTLLVGFGLTVQGDMIRAWDLQRIFWNQLIRLTPDLDKGTVILVSPDGLIDTTNIGANTWSLPRILENIYLFPDNWGINDVPRVYRLTPDWEIYILGEEGIFHLNARTTVASRSYDRAVDPSHVIFLDTIDNELRRSQDVLLIENRIIELKSHSSPLIQIYKPGSIYHLIIEPDVSDNN